MSDKRKRRGLRYSLVLLLMIILLAKTCGENHPSGIAEWAKHRAEMLVDLFKLKRKKMSDHMTYRRTPADNVNVEELERVSSQLKDFLAWPYLEQVFKLERRFVSLKTGEIHEQIVYGFTSLSWEEISPRKLLEMTRSYWGIENGLHYHRDVTLQEDYTRLTKGRAGQTMACLNNLILGVLLSKKKYRTIPTARRYFNAHPAEALDLFLRL